MTNQKRSHDLPVFLLLIVHWTVRDVQCGSSQGGFAPEGPGPSEVGVHFFDIFEL